MPEYTYTLNEIDRMRSCVGELIKVRQWISPTTTITAPSKPEERKAEIEDRLRTYLMAGIRTEELEAAVAEKHAREEQEKPRLSRGGAFPSGGFWGDRTPA